MAPRQAANSTLRIAIPPVCELSVSLERARFIRSFGILIPFGVGKLVQEGRALAQKRKPTNFLASSELAGIPLTSQRGRRKRDPPPKVDVPLDGVESKLEDYQMDNGMQATQTAVHKMRSGGSPGYEACRGSLLRFHLTSVA
jgi:hypothetical protein